MGPHRKNNRNEFIFKKSSWDGFGGDFFRHSVFISNEVNAKLAFSQINLAFHCSAMWLYLV